MRRSSIYYPAVNTQENGGRDLGSIPEIALQTAGAHQKLTMRTAAHVGRSKEKQR
jgi:hypothetical protein